MEKSYPIFIYTGSTKQSYGYGSEEGTEVSSFYSASKDTVFSYDCPYCKCDCETESDSASYGVTGWQEDTFSNCPICGWWSYKSEGDDTDGSPNFHSVAALLKEFSIESTEIPLEPLISYISKNNEIIRSINPAKLEELVGSIYSGIFGYKVEYCSYARPDKGIDLIVMNADEGKTIAIQVKRYKNPIELGFIHQFFGAMVAADQKEGIFLTTGRFRSGAVSQAKLLSSKSSLNISLVDGKKLLEFIGIMNSKKRPLKASDFPFWKGHPYYG